MSFPRMGRPRFWFLFCLLTAVNFASAMLAVNAGSLNAVWVIFTVTGLIWLFVAAARARDMGRSPWWSLLTWVPVLGWVVTIWLGCVASDQQGAAPLPSIDRRMA